MIFKAQNKDKNCNRPSFLLCCRKMPAYLLANQYTSLGIINSAKTIIYGVILYPNKKIISFKYIKTNVK